MNFTSLEFLAFFPAILLVYWLLPGPLRWVLLLAASYLFYFYGCPAATILLVGTTLISFWSAKRISDAKNELIRRIWLALAVTICLGSLVLFKYMDFLLETLALLLLIPEQSQIFGGLLPVGISFYTFQTLSYVLDVYRGTVRYEPHLGYYALFVSFFPQLVAGPIERPDHLLPQLKAEHSFSIENVAWGLRLTLIGYFKKWVIADDLARFVDAVYGEPSAANGPCVLLATVLFAVQIYCDFSGYSEIAAGISRMMGIRLMENFHSPYQARTIRDFWRRWHVSLTRWFTDYLYKPLGGSRKGLPRRCFHVMLVFLLSGLWHGADWTFLLWGGIHGLYMTASILWERWRPDSFPCWPSSQVGVFCQQICTFLLVCFGWIFFRASSLGDAIVLLKKMRIGWTSAGFSALCSVMGLGAIDWLQIPVALLCLYLLERSPLEAKKNLSFSECSGRALRYFYLITTVLLAWIFLLSLSEESAFLYFEF